MEASHPDEPEYIGIFLKARTLLILRSFRGKETQAMKPDTAVKHFNIEYWKTQVFKQNKTNNMRLMHLLYITSLMEMTVTLQAPVLIIQLFAITPTLHAEYLEGSPHDPRFFIKSRATSSVPLVGRRGASSGEDR